ncbi:hypothetical protein ACFL10_01460 [Patescibacteria group bacterium]
MDISVIIILVVIGLAVLLTAYVFIKTHRKVLSTADQAYIKKHWNRIVREANGNPNNAILDADKLLAHTLKARGIEGSVGEQLKAAPSLFSNLNDVWGAHKVRNQIAHEIGMKITPKEAKSNLTIYKKALKDLGAKL